MTNRPLAAVVLAGISMFAIVPCLMAATASTDSAPGVTVWVCDQPFQGNMTLMETDACQTVSTERLPKPLEGHPVVAAGSVLGSFDSDRGELSIYSRNKGRIVKRTIVRPHGIRRPLEYRLLSEPERGGVKIEVTAEKGELQYTACLSSGGLLELKPAQVQTVTVADCRLDYAIVPSMIGADLVYDPRDYSQGSQLYVPSLNMLTGLTDGNDCMLVGVWPAGQQLVRLELAGAGGERAIDAVSIAMAGQSFYLQLLEHADIWHAEVLQDGYLEKDNQIPWKRPFPAKWIGYFFVESEGISYPFFFHKGKERIWGRFIRSWYYYPCWFHDDATYIHFEKKFPPKGEMLIYFLEGHGTAQAVTSPISVMQDALGKGMAAELLDLEGIDQRLLLAHGDAVCAMTNKMQKVFEAGQEASRRSEIHERADDVADFIRMIRDRVFEYGGFAARMSKLLEARKQADPSLAKPLEMIQDTVDEIGLAAEEDLPDVSLDEVRRWTGEIKRLAAEVRPDNLERYKVLSRQCCQVAGSQDDLARDLSILTIRLMQEAGKMGVGSPERVRLAEEILAESRRILRRPTWWEPRRYHLPKPDPGTP